MALGASRQTPDVQGMHCKNFSARLREAERLKRANSGKAAVSERSGGGGAKAKGKGGGGAKGKAKAKGKGGGGAKAKGKGERKPKLTSREIDEKYINQGVELGKYMMGERDTIPLQRWMMDGKGGIRASALLPLYASRVANDPAAASTDAEGRISLLIDAPTAPRSPRLKGLPHGGRVRLLIDVPGGLHVANAPMKGFNTGGAERRTDGQD